MAHTQTRDELVALASSTAGDAAAFLEGLSPIHDQWHAEFTRTYGFLLFHYRVVRYFQQIVNAQLEPRVSGYTSDQLQQMNVPGFAANPNEITSLTSLADFSSEIESWHNAAHMRIGMATGVPMMDPRQNIFFRPFWQLHIYIDNLFQTALQRYGQNAHPGQFVDVAAVAGHIETGHHAWVPRV